MKLSAVLLVVFGDGQVTHAKRKQTQHPLLSPFTPRRVVVGPVSQVVMQNESSGRCGVAFPTSPTQALRNKIVPSARAYRLDKLMDALDGHLRGPGVSAQPPAPNEEKSVGEEPSAGAVEEETIAGVVMVGGKGAGRRALIEYVMLAGVNDTEECGRELGELLQVW